MLALLTKFSTVCITLSYHSLISLPETPPSREPGQSPLEVGQHILQGFGPLLLHVELHPVGWNMISFSYIKHLTPTHTKMTPQYLSPYYFIKLSPHAHKVKNNVG